MSIFLLGGFPVAAFFVKACQESACFFGCLFDQKGRPADRAGFVNRFIPGRVAAVRVAVTAVKDLSAFGMFFNELSITLLFGALDTR